MINSQEIATLISLPNQIREDQLNDLEQLSREYPFSPVFPQLYLKGLSIHDPITFEKKLKDYAYRVPNRTQLHRLVNAVSIIETSFEEKEENKIESEIIGEKPSSTIDTDIPEIHTPELNKTESEDHNIEESHLEHLSKEDDELLNESDIILENAEQPQVEKGSNHEQTKEFDDLERDILAHAVSSSIFLEVDEEQIENSANEHEVISNAEKTERHIPGLDSDKNSHEVSAKEEEADQKEVEEPKKSIDTSGKRSFTGWMSQFIDEDNESTPIKKKVDLKEKHNLEKPIQSFFSPVEKAKESLDESRLPVSETLAKVYMAQGNYPKAIEAYEKLLLKFPEKKSFFALQIESLKRKLN